MGSPLPLPPRATGGGNEASVSAPFILRPIATTLMIAAIVLLGGIGYRLLPVAALPTVDFPTIASAVISTAMPPKPSGRIFEQVKDVTAVA